MIFNKNLVEIVARSIPPIHAGIMLSNNITHHKNRLDFINISQTQFQLFEIFAFFFSLSSIIVMNLQILLIIIGSVASNCS